LAVSDTTERRRRTAPSSRYSSRYQALSILLAGAAAAGTAQPPFVDVAREVGIDFQYFNGMSGERYLPEIMGGGAAFFDYDGDGDLDLYLTQGQMLGPAKSVDQARPAPDPGVLSGRLYRNELVPTGVLRFRDVTDESRLRAEGYGMGVATGDFDNDGHVDLYLLNLGRNELWRNRGDGTFEDWTDRSGTGDPSWSIGASPIDYDRDGRLDLYVVNYLDFRYFRHRQCPSEMGQPDYCGPLSFPGQGDRLYRNLGGGRFADVTESAGVHFPDDRGMGVVAADFDGDGWLDLYVANDQMANRLLINARDGTFRDEALLAGVAFNRHGQPEASMGVDAADFDADGDEDLFVGNLRGETNTLYLNLGDGVFEDATPRYALAEPSFPYTVFGAAWLDFDRDGWLDLATVHGEIKALEALLRERDPFPLHQPNQMFRSVPDDAGRRTFVDVTEWAGSELAHSEVSRGLALGDIDNDGDLDLLVVNSSGPARLLLNRAADGQAWAGAALQARESAPLGLGSRVILELAGLPPHARRARVDGSYASAHDPRVLFGLSALAEAAGASPGSQPEHVPVRVEWTSGRVERFQLAVGRYSTLVEGTGERVSPR
jgi:enediyne biosynthesis protein E4